jgi:hypothetical protein
MSLRRIIAHGLVAAYLLVTLSAFLFTMARIRVPGIPRQVLLWSYGMMAPYQRDGQWAYALRAEGEHPDGRRERIELGGYFPFGRGETLLRQHLMSFKLLGEDVRSMKFVELAWRILDAERAAGRGYAVVRLSGEKWDRSPAGYEALRAEPFVDVTPITEAR